VQHSQLGLVDGTGDRVVSSGDYVILLTNGVDIVLKYPLQIVGSAFIAETFPRV